MSKVQILRKRVASLALELYEGKIDYQQFLDSIPFDTMDDTEDGGAEELVDMITNEPKVGGFLGVSRSGGEKNCTEIFALIAKLQQD